MLSTIGFWPPILGTRPQCLNTMRCVSLPWVKSPTSRSLWSAHTHIYICTTWCPKTWITWETQSGSRTANAETLGALRLGSLLALGFGEAPLGHVGRKDLLVKPCRIQSVARSLIFKPVVHGLRRVPTSSPTTWKARRLVGPGFGWKVGGVVTVGMGICNKKQCYFILSIFYINCMLACLFQYLLIL